MKAFQKLVNVLSKQLRLPLSPEIILCDVSRQNECIRKKNEVPCSGGCYHAFPKPIIYLREMYGGYDTLLHELFHHVNNLNHNDAIWEIMNYWHRTAFKKKKGYGKLLEELK